MSGKMEFGCDYLIIMRNLVMQSTDKNDFVADAAARLFLLQWGFSVIEIDEVNKLFWDRVNSGTLEDDLLVVAGRIAKHIENDKDAQNRLVVGLAAIGLMDGNVTDAEAGFVRHFQGVLDLKPSEFSALCAKGEDWAIALSFFGEQYLQSKNQKP